ncbi:TPA: hypothetical protein N0F65_012376, partial [Lagenidium giganteum]
RERSALMADAFRPLISDPRQLSAALFLAASQVGLAPPYEGRELRFGTKTFRTLLTSLLTQQQSDLGGAVETAADIPTSVPDYAVLVNQLIQQGHLRLAGDHHAEGPARSIAAVHDALLAIAGEEGSGAVARKQVLATTLLLDSTTVDEAIVLSRLLAHQKLRIGMGDKSILSALGLAACPATTEPDAIQAMATSVKQAFARRPDFAALAQTISEAAIFEDTRETLHLLEERAAPTPGVPVLTMSAYPVTSFQEVLTRLRKSTAGAAACEYKYDGARVQVHLRTGSNGIISGRIFSRNIEDNTPKYESLLYVLDQQRLPHVSDCILEGEVVAIDRQTNRLLPFQILQQKVTTDFCLFAFDLLELNGNSLLERSLEDRREILRTHFSTRGGFFEFVASHDVTVSADISDDEAINKIQRVLEQAVGSSCEGLMVKTLDAPYRAGERSFSWMKVKHDYILSSVADSASSPEKHRKQQDHGAFLPDALDLIPIGAYHGRGRRAGVYGSFLLAAFDPLRQRFETIGKVGSGFTDASLEEITNRFQADALTSPPAEYDTNLIRSLQPDVWFQPREVWEIRATQLTLSPSHTCGRGVDLDSSKGLALRFPRFLRVRDDKSIQDATSSCDIRQFYQQQFGSEDAEST